MAVAFASDPRLRGMPTVLYFSFDITCDKFMQAEFAD
jgi:hypothetical protein